VTAHTLATTDLPLELVRRGKVRDVYRLPAHADAAAPAPVLIVATDRISAFDVVMRTPVPGKGRLLTRMSRLWFEFIEERALARTHTLSWETEEAWGLTEDQRTLLAGRVCKARPAEVLPVECVVRGYLDGTGWREYQQTGAVCGVRLPDGLRRADRLPEPIFTPTTKARDGEHDENITFEHAAAIAGDEPMRRARDISLAIYRAAAAHAEDRGLILADTKFEFGWPLIEPSPSPLGDTPAYERDPDRLMLIDEALTPDSSRYWPRDGWEPGGAQASFDKQFVREHLQSLVDAGVWDKSGDADGLGPELPDEVVAGTLARYREALQRLWGESGVA
jgi:phosphoribosylaminoimidazole-succinocarboxamide synthase